MFKNNSKRWPGPTGRIQRPSWFGFLDWPTAVPHSPPGWSGVLASPASLWRVVASPPLIQTVIPPTAGFKIKKDLLRPWSRLRTPCSGVGQVAKIRNERTSAPVRGKFGRTLRSLEEEASVPGRGKGRARSGAFAGESKLQHSLPILPAEL